MKRINDIEEIRSIVREVLNTMYRNNISDLTFRVIEKFTMKPNIWDITVDFKYNNHEITVDVEVDEIDGIVPYAREIIRW